MDKLLLPLITFLPLLGMVVILCIPGRMVSAIRGASVVITAVVFALTLMLWGQFDPAALSADSPLAAYDARTLIEREWISSYHIYFRFGVDGLSVMLIVLTGLLSFLAAFTAFTVKKQVKAFFALYMLLVTGMMGVFMSLDFFLFYVFWELMLLPMYFLIGIWGGERRAYAAIKFFVYTLGNIEGVLGKAQRTHL